MHRVKRGWLNSRQPKYVESSSSDRVMDMAVYVSHEEAAPLVPKDLLQPVKARRNQLSNWRRNVTRDRPRRNCRGLVSCWWAIVDALRTA
jgi:hypothetical protein